ncbi:MAG: hypothetical protein WAW85_03665, partial [Gordonia sp. (in: high G+C Gram-positive bacteria)]|uniref:hypothetical protein n=1 Tax=Gordonia sp. (in: high G+C Gram-positive bacteria) TaxID=84139 RepID=UPI003BB497E3
PALTAAVDQVLATAAATRAVLGSGDDHLATDTQAPGPTVLDRLPGASSQPGSALFDAGLALTGMNWTLQHAATVSARGHTAYLPWNRPAAQTRNTPPAGASAG